MSTNRGNKSELKTSLSRYFFLRKGWPWTIIWKPSLIWARAGWEEAARCLCWSWLSWIKATMLFEEPAHLWGYTRCSECLTDTSAFLPISSSLCHLLAYTVWALLHPDNGLSPLDLFLWGLRSSLHHVWMALLLQGWNWLHHPCCSWVILLLLTGLCESHACISPRDTTGVCVCGCAHVHIALSK